MSDTITILVSRGRRLAKTFHANGTVSNYDAARTFDLHEAPIADLAALGMGLYHGLLDAWSVCVVRGAIVDQQRVWGVRRLLRPDKETGDQPTLREVPRRWLAIDVDKVAQPSALPAADLAGCSQVAIAALPEPFHVARCIAQATASHGFKPEIRMRLWYWLDRPLGGVELRRWLARTPCDLSVFEPAQPIYTARPLFDAGVSDPSPERLFWRDGAEAVEAPPAEALAPHRRRAPPPPPRFTNPAAANDYARQHLEAAAHEILEAGEGMRHRVLVRAAARLGALVRGRVVAEPAARAVLTRAAEASGLELQEIESAVEWGLTRTPAVPSFEVLEHA